MNLQEQVSRIHEMMGVVNENKNLIAPVQKIINQTMDNIISKSDDFGLGEMDELDEIYSVRKIVVDDVINKDAQEIYITMYITSDRTDFYNYTAELEFEVQKLLPKSTIFINDIVSDIPEEN